MEWNQFKRKKCVVVNKAIWNYRSEEHFDIRHGDAEFGICPAVFSLALIQCFLTMSPSQCFRMVMYILCHYMMEVCDLLFDFAFYMLL